jgi:hypothetical protein
VDSRQHQGTGPEYEMGMVVIPARRRFSSVRASQLDFSGSRDPCRSGTRDRAGVIPDRVARGPGSMPVLWIAAALCSDSACGLHTHELAVQP